MDEEPRPRRDPEDEAAEPYRLRDDDEPEPPRRRPRPARDRDDDDEPDERPRRRRGGRRNDGPIRKRSLSVPLMDLRVKLVLWGLFGLLVLIGLGAFCVWYWHRLSQTAPFKPYMTQYLSPPIGSAPGRPTMGKIIVVDTAKRDVDWDIFFSLPDELRPVRPEEVGTIVWTNWGKDQVDSYENGAPAYVQWCKVTVIDRRTRTTIAESGQFRGTDAPMSIDSNSGSGSGSKPTEQVLEFLKRLPHG